MFLQFYGLNEQPFGVTPDPRFMYMGRTQQEALSSLIYGIETGRGFMALIASPGSGKTTMLLQLMDRLRESARTAFLFQTHTNSEEFLRCLLTDLDIEPSGHDLGDLQRQLGDVLIREAAAGKRIVVAIDEAQNLDDKVLEMVRMLSNFETPQAKLLQVILVGQPQLADKLASPHLQQLRQRVSIITHFLPLEAKDIQKYINHRLRVAGYRGDELFAPAALRLIVTHSNGIPRNINNLCFQALSLGYAKNQKKIDDATMQEVIADLSLESLGTSPPVLEKTPVRHSGGTRDSRKEIKIGAIPPSSPVTPGYEPDSREETSPLDAVNLFSHSTIEDVNTTLGARRPTGGRKPVGHQRKFSFRPILWFGLATLLGYLWVGPRLKSGLDSLEGVIPGVGMKPIGKVTTTSAPAVTGTNLPGTMTGRVENGLTLSKEDMRTGSQAENEVQTAAETTSTAAGGAKTVVPPIRLKSSQTPRPPATFARETPPTRYRGYTPGSGRLVVESNISGARITINGESNHLWTTPRLFSLASGTYLVSVSGGANQIWTRRVHVDEGREQFILANLENEEGGIFTVDTDPPGMQVFIDGKPFGPSRVETVLRPGWHVCAVIPEPGHEPLVSRFHIGPGEALTRRIRIASQPASLWNEMPRPENNAASSAPSPQGGTP